MYHFNLLPLAEQKRTRWWIIQAQLNLGFFIVNAVIIALIALFWLGNALIDAAQVASDSRLQELRLAHVGSNGTADIQTLNARIQALGFIQRTHPDLLSDIGDISTALTDGILLTSLSLNYDDRLASITGTAATRADLESFQISIERNEHLQLKTFPFEAFTQPREIPFTITMTIQDHQQPTVPPS